MTALGARLRRIRLDGIGPTGARFDPLTIDLRRGGDAARIALLYLENGGGKSVLLRLLFSVFLPGKRNVVGGAKLTDYVLSRDVGHVICEWEVDEDGALTPSLFVTGEVLEWQGGNRSADASRLQQTWYSFRPRAGVVDLDTLQTRRDGHRVSRAGFVAALTEAQRATPTLNVVVAQAPGVWREHLLTSTPLDPELFRYQRSMNVDESDADELFAKVDTGEKFVRFLLTAAADPDEMAEFGTLLDRYAGQAASRDELELRRTFHEAAVGVLRDLATAEATRGVAAESVVDADRRADHFARSLLAEVDRATCDAADRDRDAASAGVRADAAREEVNRLDRLARELRRQAALFGVASAEDEVQRATEAVRAVELDLAAWTAVPRVLEARRAGVRRRELTEKVRLAETAEQPYREARDRAAAALRAAVKAAQASLDEEVAGAQTRAKKLAAQERAARDAAVAAKVQAEAADREARSLTKQVGDAERERAALVTDGIVHAAEPADVAAARHRAAGIAARERLDAIAARRTEVTARQRAIRELDRELATVLAEAEASLRSTEGERGRFFAERDAFLGAERVAGLVGDTTDFWYAAEQVDETLARAIVAAEARIRDLSVAVNDDEAAIEAIGLDGVLPPSADVRSAFDALRAERIAATPGWSWLTQLTPDDRESALAANPALSGGLIVTNPADLDRARTVLDAAGLDVRSVVTVGPASVLSVAVAADMTFAVPPNPALYDEAYADAERVRLTAKIAAARTERADTESATTADRTLRARIAELTHRWSAAAVEALEADLRSLREQIATARGEVEQLASEARDLDAEVAELDSEATQRAAAERAAVIGAERSDRLARTESDAADARERIPTLAERAELLRTQAVNHETTEEAARRDAQTELGRAAELRRHRVDLDRVLEGVPVTDLTVPAGDEPVDDLRTAFVVATEALEGVAAGDDLHASLQAAEVAEATAIASLDALDADARARADENATSSAATSAASLDETTRASAGRLTSAREADKAAGVRLGLAKRQLESQSRPGSEAAYPYTDLTDEWRPADADHANLLADRATANKSAAAEDQRTAEDAQRRAASAAGEAKMRAQVLEAYAGRLGRHTADETELVGVAPWRGTVEAAKDRTETLAADRGAAQETHSHAVEQRRHAFDQVRRAAGEARFANLHGVRVAMTTENIDSLAARAERLVHDVGVGLKSVTKELEEVDKHRDGVIERLTTLVEQQLNLVSLARRFSKVPAGLGEWSDQHFCRIDYHPPERIEIAARVAGVVDEVAARAKRDPLPVVLDATIAAVARHTATGDKTFEVRLLKPNKAMFVDLVDVSRMGEEYSGGQRLTTAIMLYCTLAALRAHARGGSDHAGVLFLDNPIGKANADYLLDLQTAVAAKAGIQLVYTTGLFDPEVHQAFECVVRLRNDADLRRHLNYIVLDEATAAAVTEGRSADDRHAYVSGVRLAVVQPSP